MPKSDLTTMMYVMGQTPDLKDTLTVERWQERLEQWRPIFLGCWIGVFLCVGFSLAFPYKMNWNPYFHGVLGYDHEALVDASIPPWIWDSGTASQQRPIQEGRDRLRLLTLGMFIVFAVSVVPIGTGRRGSALRIIQASLPAALLSIALLALVLEQLGLWQAWVESSVLAGMGRLALMFGGLWMIWGVVAIWWWSDIAANRMLRVMWLIGGAATILLLLLRRESGTGDQAAWILGMLAWIYASGMLALWSTTGENTSNAMNRLRKCRWQMQHQRIARLFWPPWRAMAIVVLGAICTVISMVLHGTKSLPPRTLRPALYDWIFSWLNGPRQSFTPSNFDLAVFILIVYGPILFGWLGLWTYLFVGGMRSARKLMAEPKCLECGYDLRGNLQAGICPECGNALDPVLMRRDGR